MAYVTFTLQRKIQRLQELENRQALGPMKVQGSGDRVSTEFDTKDINIEHEIAKLIDSILTDPGFNDSNPFYAAIVAAQRPGQTIPIYVNKFNPWMEL